jgi:hypothetical protein
MVESLNKMTLEEWVDGSVDNEINMMQTYYACHAVN